MSTVHSETSKLPDISGGVLVVTNSWGLRCRTGVNPGIDVKRLEWDRALGQVTVDDKDFDPNY